MNKIFYDHMHIIAVVDETLEIVDDQKPLSMKK